MEKRTVINLSAKDIQASDTTAYDKFKDVALSAGVETIIGEYNFTSGNRATWGGGKAYVVLYDDTTTAAREEGTFRFYVVGASGETKMTHEVTSYQLGPDGKSADTDVWYYMPEGGYFCGKGGKLRVTFESAAADTLDSTDNLFYGLPIVIYS